MNSKKEYIDNDDDENGYGSDDCDGYEERSFTLVLDTNQ